jgi:hypothetical protein
MDADRCRVCTAAQEGTRADAGRVRFMKEVSWQALDACHIWCWNRVSSSIRYAALSVIHRQLRGRAAS